MNIGRPALVATALLLSVMLAAAQQSQPSGGTGAEGETPAPIGPPSSYAVGEKPPPVEKVYRKKQEKVWESVIEAIQEAGIEIETSDPSAGYIRTQLTPFDPNRFINVAMPPPPISRERMIRQWAKLNRGRFSIEVIVRSAERGTSVSVQAYIEEHVAEISTRRRFWAERYSNGTIEKYFFDRFDKALE